MFTPTYGGVKLFDVCNVKCNIICFAHRSFYYSPTYYLVVKEQNKENR